MLQSSVGDVVVDSEEWFVVEPPPVVGVVDDAGETLVLDGESHDQR